MTSYTSASKTSLETISPDFEIILVEDCGGDNSWQLIERLTATDARVRGVQFSRNFGQHYGITAGLDLCRGDWVVVMDCDLQDQPEEIPRLYAKAMEGYEVVLARRGVRQDPVLKRWTSGCSTKCSAIWPRSNTTDKRVTFASCRAR